MEGLTERIVKAIVFKSLAPEPTTIHVLKSNYTLYRLDT